MPDGIQNTQLNYRYHLIDMHTIDCEHFLKQNDPDALIIAILCDFKGKDAAEIIHHIITQLKHYHKDNEQGFRDSIAMLEVLSDNRNLKHVVQEEEEKMLSAVNIENLPSYNIGRERGKGEGLEQGLEQEHHLLSRLVKRRYQKVNTNNFNTIITQFKISEELEQIGDWIISCDLFDDLMIKIQSYSANNKNNK